MAWRFWAVLARPPARLNGTRLWRWLTGTRADERAGSGPREFAAFIGLTPRQNSSGGKERLGRISKMGNRYLRKLLVVGAHAVLHYRKAHSDELRAWADRLMQTKPFRLVAVAIANKLARIVFALMRDGTRYADAPG